MYIYLALRSSIYIMDIYIYIYTVIIYNSAQGSEMGSPFSSLTL